MKQSMLPVGIEGPELASRGRVYTRARGPNEEKAVPMALVLAMMLAFASSIAHAHDARPLAASGAGPFTAGWSADPWIGAAFGALLCAHAVVSWVLLRRPGRSRMRHARRALLVLAGMGLAAVVLFGPLDALADRSLALHTVQHMTLMAAAAPLVAAGAPIAAAGAALGPRWWARVPRGWRSLRQGTQALRGVPAATVLQAGVMWIWHLPAMTAAALADERVHALMHTSFLAAGVLFWAALLRSVRAAPAGFGTGALAVATTLAHMGLLGALLFFAPRPLYADYAVRVASVGLDWRTDQQLAGIVMWVPACVPYLVGGVWLLVVWLRRIEVSAVPHGSARPR